MAGRKNHILPKLLLRGFTIDTQRKSEQLFSFTKDGRAFSVSIDKIAAARDYYKLHDSTFIDEMMGKDEEIYGSIINRIRDSLTIQDDDNAYLNKFAFDLFIRSKNMVQELEKSLTELVNNIDSDTYRDTFVDTALTKAINNIKTKKIKQLIKESMTEYGAKKTKHVIPLLTKQISSFLDSQSFREHAKQNIKEAFPLFKEKIAETISKGSKLGQLQALESRYIEPQEYHRFNFTWTLLTRQRDSFILGDVGPLFLSNGDITSLIWVKGEINAVYLPLSSKTIAIGHTKNELAPISTENMNTASALFSTDFFVASANNEDITSLTNLIGTNQLYLQNLDNTITQWFDEFLNKSQEHSHIA